MYNVNLKDNEINVILEALRQAILYNEDTIKLIEEKKDSPFEKEYFETIIKNYEDIIIKFEEIPF